jgi:hypothetical protein
MSNRKKTMFYCKNQGENFSTTIHTSKEIIFTYYKSNEHYASNKQCRQPILLFDRYYMIQHSFNRIQIKYTPCVSIDKALFHVSVDRKNSFLYIRRKRIQ